MKFSIPLCALLLCSLAARQPSLLAADGGLDPSFQPSDIQGGQLATQSDGKVLLTVRSGTTKKLVRLNADGTLDTAFPPAAINDLVSVVGVQADDKILIAGNFTSVGGAPAGSFARLNADGTLDPSFTPPTGGPRINRFEALDDGRIVLSVADRAGLKRLKADGTLDPTFVVDPAVTLAQNPPFGVLPEGRLIVAYPDAADDSIRLARLNADGSVDATFRFPADGLANVAGVPQFRLDAEHRIIVFASTVVGDNLDPANFTPFVRRFNADGSLDGAFISPTITGAASNGSNLRPGINVALGQTDGKIVVGGVFTALNGTPEPGVARLNNDGSVDLDFVAGGGQFTGGFGVPSQVDDLLFQGSNLLVTGFLGGAATEGEESSGIGTARLLTGVVIPLPPEPPVAVPLSDLSSKVSGFKAKLSADGSKLKIKGKLTVKNRGPGKAKNVQVAAFVSDDQTLDSEDVQISAISLKEEGFKKIKPYDATGPIPFNFKIPAAAAAAFAGKYVLVVVDPDDAIEEFDEDNNELILGPLPSVRAQ